MLKHKEVLCITFNREKPMVLYNLAYNFPKGEIIIDDGIA